MIGIYEIVNIEDGKATAYVGSSQDIKKRWKKHKNALRRGAHHNGHLQRAWNLYGEGAFIFSVLKEVEGADILLAIEQEYLDDYFDRGRCYNIAQEAAAPMLGHLHTEEAKRKMMGYIVTEETRRRISKAHIGRKRGTMSEEHKRKLSEAGKGNQNSLGYKHTDETRRKMSAAQMGNQNTLGYKHTDEAKRKISKSLMGNQSALGYKHTDETKRKIGKMSRRAWAKKKGIA